MYDSFLFYCYITFTKPIGLQNAQDCIVISGDKMNYLGIYKFDLQI